ncbi:hypothetical protein TNCV_2487911 [Trichonephila clavipes]|uniref:Uncharacterized protein n=1 Tax=Trichonephila clavipes TaxID=2585209 RepID=A0A8X6W0F8_TRICX|nr:hypothetical protein TNCV_2487911 [Trichonephila clavipes]
MCIHHDATKHGCDHLDALNRTWIPPKKWRLTICGPMFVVDHTIEYTPVSDAVSNVAADMVSELRIHAAANVIELFVLTLVFLQASPILNSGLETRLHDQLRPCA